MAAVVTESVAGGTAERTARHPCDAAPVGAAGRDRARPTALSVAAGVWVGVGARDEPDELSGVSHFLEHLLFKGTEERSARAIAAAVDRVGGDMNAFTAKEYTAYYCRVPATELPLALELLGDVLTAPALRDGDVDNERQVILEELAMDDDLPEDVVHRLLAEAMFPGHALGRETAGTMATVETITPDDVRAFFRQWYRPSSMVVAVAGACDHDQVLAEVERRFPATGPVDLPQTGGARQRAGTTGGGPAPHRAGPARARLPGPSPRRRRPRGARRPQPRAGRRPVEPAVRGDPRAAGSGLRRRLRHGVVRRRRLTRRLGGDGAGPGRRGAQPHRHRGRRAPDRRNDRGRARDGRRLPHGSVRDGPGGQRQPDGPPGCAADDHGRRPPGRGAARTLAGRHRRRRRPG